MPTLHWIGKDAVVNHHKTVPFRLLHNAPEQGLGATDTGNLLVEGDNLLALKALLPRYAGQVKCIYIDPPYNTGNEGWIYNDAVNAPEMRKWLHHAVGKEAEDLSRHDKWLCMMYPRLQLLRQFLRDDGLIFVSIDDNEVANLRLIMDEIFGPRNFLASLIWQKKYAPQNDARFFSPMHDYITVYSRNIERCKLNLAPRTDKQDKAYKNTDDDPRGAWKPSDLTRAEYRERDHYAITTPSGKLVYPSKGRSWSRPPAEIDRLRADNRLYFGKNNDAIRSLKWPPTEVKQGVVPVSLWFHEDVGHTDEAKKEVSSFFAGEAVFDTPKPTRLITRILQLATDKNSLVLDSFAGSGTTGHAVMQLNREDGGNRRFLLVEMDPHIARNVTAERLRRVACGRTEEEKRRGGEEETEEQEKPEGGGLFPLADGGIAAGAEDGQTPGEPLPSSPLLTPPRQASATIHWGSRCLMRTGT